MECYLVVSQIFPTSTILLTCFCLWSFVFYSSFLMLSFFEHKKHCLKRVVRKTLKNIFLGKKKRLFWHFKNCNHIILSRNNWVNVKKMSFKNIKKCWPPKKNQNLIFVISITNFLALLLLCTGHRTVYFCVLLWPVYFYTTSLRFWVHKVLKENFHRTWSFENKNHIPFYHRTDATDINMWLICNLSLKI